MTEFLQALDQLIAWLRSIEITGQQLWIYAALAQALPRPQASRLYLFAYRVAHVFAANICLAPKGLPTRHQTAHEAHLEAKLSDLNSENQALAQKLQQQAADLDRLQAKPSPAPEQPPPPPPRHRTPET